MNETGIGIFAAPEKKPTKAQRTAAVRHRAIAETVDIALARAVAELNDRLKEGTEYGRPKIDTTDLLEITRTLISIAPAMSMITAYDSEIPEEELNPLEAKWNEPDDEKAKRVEAHLCEADKYRNEMYVRLIAICTLAEEARIGKRVSAIAEHAKVVLVGLEQYGSCMKRICELIKE